MLSRSACASTCLRAVTYPMIRTGFSVTVVLIPRIEEIRRETGAWKPGGDNLSQKIWICIAIFC
jgi:hypothetical protein